MYKVGDRFCTVSHNNWSKTNEEIIVIEYSNGLHIMRYVNYPNPIFSCSFGSLKEHVDRGSLIYLGSKIPKKLQELADKHGGTVINKQKS